MQGYKKRTEVRPIIICRYLATKVQILFHLANYKHIYFPTPLFFNKKRPDSPPGTRPLSVNRKPQNKPPGLSR